MTVKDFLEAIQKGAITTSTGGQLSAEQAKQFINTVVDENPFFGAQGSKDGEIEVIPMTASQRQIDVIELASRIMRPGVEGTAPSTTVAPTIKRRTLTAKEVLLPYDVTFSFLEENIEGEDVDALLQVMFATQFGNDLLDLAINGDDGLAETITDTAPADGFDDTTGLSQNDHTFLRQNNGWVDLIVADSDTHVASLTSSSRDFKGVIFPALMDAIPQKWLADKSKLSFYVSPKMERTYRAQVAGRETALGDQLLISGRKVQFDGIDVVAVTNWPDLNPTLTLKKNLKVGVGRSLRVGKQIQERKRIIEFTLTGKVDAEMAVADAVSYAVLTTS